MTPNPDVKTIAFVAYPGLTLLDLAGPIQVLSALAAGDPRYRVVVVAEKVTALETDAVLSITATHSFDEVPHPDYVVVPGGAVPTMRALGDATLLNYLREAAKTAELMTSVCTGALLLGAAGVLTGRRATTHWMCVDLLSEFGATPVRERWVADGPVITAAGVSAGIDVALHLCERLAGADTARTIQLIIEYDPQPPHGPIDWESVHFAQYTPGVAAWVREGLTADPVLAERLVARL